VAKENGVVAHSFLIIGLTQWSTSTTKIEKDWTNSEMIMMKRWLKRGRVQIENLPLDKNSRQLGEREASSVDTVVQRMNLMRFTVKSVGKKLANSASFFLDTNVFILLSGLSSNDLSILSRAIAENKIRLCMSHVQIDEQRNQESSNYQNEIKETLKKLSEKGVNIIIEPTNEIILSVSRLGYAKFGSKKLGEIDKALRQEIERCVGEKKKNDLNIARDALIALSSLNHDYFITADRCLFKSWKTIIESNEENKKALEKEYKVPEIIQRRKHEGVFQAITSGK
jgi:hypothetical protein